MKRSLLAILTITQIVKVFSQTPAELENKYWNYRDRFKKYFTQIGQVEGQSQTAASIEFHGVNSLNYRIVNGSEQSTNNTNYYQNRIDFGDAVIDQGWYMAVLASEYWILKNKGQMHTDQFKSLCNELYFAINAIERLDGNADKYYGQNFNLLRSALNSITFFMPHILLLDAENIS